MKTFFLLFVFFILILLATTSFIFDSKIIVTITSDSMDRKNEFDIWWEEESECTKNPCRQRDWYMEHNISKEKFLSFPFSNGIKKGTKIIVDKNTKPQIGDVVLIRTYTAKPTYLVHRVTKINTLENTIYYETKGDASRSQITNINYFENEYCKETCFNEKNISEKMVVGTVIANHN